MAQPTRRGAAGGKPLHDIYKGIPVLYHIYHSLAFVALRDMLLEILHVTPSILSTSP